MLFICKTTYFTGYTDGNTKFAVPDNKLNILKALAGIDENKRKLFSNIQMKLNANKCHYNSE